MPFDQKNYIATYNKANYKLFPFRVRQDNVEVLEKLESVSNRNHYLLSLIEEDLHPSILTIKQIKAAVLPILNGHGIREVYLFGSYSRGEAHRDSDVDIYCEVGDIRTLWDQNRLLDELKAALGRSVDLVFEGSDMDKTFRENLMEDRIRLC